MRFPKNLRCYSVAVFIAAGPPMLPAYAQPRAAAQIDWTAAKNAMTSAGPIERSRSGGLSRREARIIELPVLVINDGAVKAAPEIRHQIRSYTAYYEVKGATLAVTGLSRPLALKDNTPQTASEASVMQSDYKFEVQEDSSDLSFERFGAFYNMRISCEKAADERCTNPDFLKAIADKLAVIGGKKL